MKTSNEAVRNTHVLQYCADDGTGFNFYVEEH
jgi:hypothetical protein